MDKTGDKSIVCWQPHGRAFMVHKPKDFVQEVMPHFFNQTKYASFQRQLNLYGFSRLTHGPDKGAYYHNCFIRGKRHLCKGMIRQKIKGTKVRKSLSPEDEPNFYDMEAQNQIIDPSGKVHKDNTNNFNQSSSLPQTRLAKAQVPPKVVSSEESLVSLIPSAPLNAFDPSSNIGSFKPLTRMVTQETSLDSKMEQLPTQSTNPSTSRIMSPQHLTNSDAWGVYDEVKGGDLLYFEGLPFRYLEHFEAVPPNQQIDKTNPLQLSKTTTRYQPPQVSSDPPNDPFQERLSKIVFNHDLARGFQKDLMQNTSCLA